MSADAEWVIRRAYQAFDRRDLEALTEIADESIEISTVTGLMAGRDQPYRGHEGIASYLADIGATWKRMELQPQQFIELGEGRVLVFGRARVWHERGFLDSSNAWLWTLRDDKVVSVRVFADPAEARRAFSGEL